ncbi:uncharacterized protein LOC135206457 [Macrobrachium nipponense]|uniref:uncharacterized protein LOC135206457 n=1 Tax=Macrobrachium nipponense TaxID=159736 RepID=UPI0030C8395B
MKFVIVIASLVSVAFAAPQYGYGRGGGGSSEEIPILRDDRDRDDFGRYSVNVETANGIVLADAGAPRRPKAGRRCVLWIFLVHFPRGHSSPREVRCQRKRLPAPVRPPASGSRVPPPNPTVRPRPDRLRC